MTMTSIDVLPCPFCGSDAVTYYSYDFNEWTIRCTNDNCFCDFGYDPDKSVVVKMWNTRNSLHYFGVNR
jgi:hypothetical protein